MSLCSLNITIGIFVDKFMNALMISLTKKKITGLYGSIFDDYLVFNGKRNCEFKRTLCFLKEDATNERDRNLTGVHLLETNQIDFNPFGQKLDYLNEKLERTTVNNIISYKVYQTLNMPDKLENYDVYKFFVQNYKDFLAMLMVYFMVSAFFLKLLRKSHRAITFDRFSLNTFTYDELSNFSFKSPLTNLLLSWNLFFWLYLLILSNNIKTEKILVNTDDFIDSFDKLSRTPKTFFFFHLDEDVFKKVSKDVFLYKLYFKKVVQEKNYFKYWYNSNEEKEKEKREFHTKNDLSSFFVLAKEDYLPSYLIYVTQFVDSNQFGYMDQNVYYEYFGVNYFRKNLDKDKKAKILKIMQNYFEKQLGKNAYIKVRKLGEPKYKFFRSTTDYIKEYNTRNESKFSFKNYRKLFALVFFIYFVLIIAFWIKLSKKNYEAIRMAKYVNRFKQPIFIKAYEKSIRLESERKKEIANKSKEVKEIKD